MSRRVVLLALALAALASQPALAEPPPAADSRIKSQTEEFNRAKDRLKSAFTAKFATVMGQVRGSRALNGQVKAAKLEALKAEQAQFDTNGVLPESDEMLPYLWQYQRDLHKARSGLVKSYQTAIDASVRGYDDKRVKALKEAKSALDMHIPGRAAFATPATWKGSRHDGTGTNAEVTLAVTEVRDNTFKGTFRQSRGGSGTVAVEGGIEGAWIEFRSTAVLSGKTKALAFGGFLLGERILVAVGGVSADGNAEGGLVLLNRPPIKAPKAAATRPAKTDPA